MAENNIAEKVRRIKSRLQSAKEDRARLEGSLEENMTRLESEFGFKTLADAQRGLEKMTKEAEKLEKTLVASLSDLEEKYGDFLQAR